MALTDDYSRKTIALLLERNRSYLVKILEHITPDSIPAEIELNIDNVSAIIANQNVRGNKLHKSSIYKCRCGSDAVITREVQIRSADEGTTIVHMCKKCGNRWS